jgi:hypothetical protein
MWLRTHRKGDLVWTGDSVGGTPTAAVETTALPKKSLMIGSPVSASHFALEEAVNLGNIGSNMNLTHI